ncbi:MAG: AbrB/MazE/SpoVT family DNA-binding domain-containing protein [Candidatus Micrarchaeota archaeon]|nr:AbrB/MazE/SpoVT family DNA-binding domain-containing protein [Candidatus Micrarchaeota archaeon]
MTDEGVRITIGRKLVKRYGRRFFVVPTERDIVLVPVPKDPVGELGRIGKEAGLDKFSMKQIRKFILEEASKEARSTIRLASRAGRP